MKPLTIKHFIEFEYPSAPSFSPDGKYAAYVVQTVDTKGDGYKGDIWLHENGVTRRLTYGGDAKSFCWTDDGRILFRAMRDSTHKKCADSGEPLTCYYEISPDGGEARPAFTIPLSCSGIKPIGGDRFIVTAIHDNRFPDFTDLDDAARKEALDAYNDPKVHVFEEFPFWQNGDGFSDGQRTRLYLYNRASDQLTPLTGGWFDVEGYSFVDETLLVTGVEWRGIAPVFDHLGVYVVPLTIGGGEMRELLAPGTLYVGGAELWDSSTALLFATDGARFGATEYKDFYTLDLATGDYSVLTPYDHSIGYGSVGSDAKLGSGRQSKMTKDGFYLVTTVDESAQLRRLDRHGNLSDNLTPYGSCDSFDVYGDRLLNCCSLLCGLSEVYLDGVQITSFNAALDGVSLSKPLRQTYTGSDGMEICGYCLQPTDLRAGEIYPAILHIHGGPRTVFGDVYHHEMQVWANAGYFVFYCNPRGSDGKGSAFGDICGMYGDVDYINLMEFTDQMLAAYPQADPERLAVAGGSYGGFMANWMIGHTDRFRCAVSQRSISNWIAFEHTSDIGPGFTLTNHGTTTRQNPARLFELSPLAYVNNCTTPTLFIHSDMDYRCPVTEGMSMFAALKMQGVEAKMVLFHGENHELSRSGKPSNRIRRMEEILRWLDQHLKP